MVLNLNDFSITPIASDEDWSAFDSHMSLVRQLDVFGIDKVLFNESLDGLIGYLRGAALTSARQKVLFVFFQRHYYRGVVAPNYFIQLTTAEDAPFSILLPDAVDKDAPVISYTINKAFAVDEIKGYKRTLDKAQLERISVKNIFKYDYGTILKTLPSFRRIARSNPLLEPLWNQDFILRYLEHIKHKEHRPSRNLSGGEKLAYIIEHGGMIAELCGWRLHKALSSNNSSDSGKRVIYYSALFKDKDAYLCLDLEKVDFHFELCDYRGRHQGEFNWDGTKTEEPRADHSIRI